MATRYARSNQPMVATSNYDRQSESIAVGSPSYNSTGTLHTSLMDRVEDIEEETLKICGIAWHIFTIGVCVAAVVLTVVILVVVFTIQTPSVSLVTVYARDTNITTIIPINVVLAVDNPNIIGATVSSPRLEIYDVNMTFLGNGTVDETSFDARATTNVTVELSLPISDALERFFNSILQGPNDTTVTVVADVEIFLGALQPQFTITETKSVPPYQPSAEAAEATDPTDATQLYFHAVDIVPPPIQNENVQSTSEPPIITRISKRPITATRHRGGKYIFKN